jgi:hypothetical protein
VDIERALTRRTVETYGPMTVQGTDISCDQCGLVVTTAIRRGPMPGRPANEPVRAYAIAEKGWGIEGERDLCPSHVASRSEAHEMEIKPPRAEVDSVIRAR